MKRQHPTARFLQDNPNPTLGDLLAQYDNVNTGHTQYLAPPAAVIQEIKKEVDQLSVPLGINRLLDQIQQQIEDKAYAKAKEKVKNGLKRIRLLTSHDSIQQKIGALQNSLAQIIATSYAASPHEQALELLAELVHMKQSTYTSIEETKKMLTPAAFKLYIAYQTIGCVDGDGWAIGVFGNMPQLVPHITPTFEDIGFHQTAKAVRDTVDVFPRQTSFLIDDEAYIDVLNFIEHPRRKVDNPSLNHYSQEEREEFCRNYQRALQQLEAVDQEIWHDASDNLSSYYHRHLDEKIWVESSR